MLLLKLKITIVVYHFKHFLQNQCKICDILKRNIPSKKQCFSFKLKEEFTKKINNYCSSNLKF